MAGGVVDGCWAPGSVVLWCRGALMGTLRVVGLDRWLDGRDSGWPWVQVAWRRRWQRSNAATSSVAHGQPAAMRRRVCRPVRAISPAVCSRV